MIKWIKCFVPIFSVYDMGIGYKKIYKFFDEYFLSNYFITEQWFSKLKWIQILIWLAWQWSIQKKIAFINEWMWEFYFRWWFHWLKTYKMFWILEDLCTISNTSFSGSQFSSIEFRVQICSDMFRWRMENGESEMCM